MIRQTNRGPAAESSEDARLNALHRYTVLDTPAEREFDDIARLAKLICGTPVALITLVDSTRQWFKSCIGLEVTEMAREIAFCDQAIRQSNVFIVNDARVHPRFAQNPLVTGEPHIRFYAGAPLITSDKFALGTICVVDFEPRDLCESQILALEALARQTVAQLELRKSVMEAKRSAEQYRSLFEHNFDAVCSMDLEGRILSANGKCCDLTGFSRTSLVGRPFGSLVSHETMQCDMDLLIAARNGDASAGVMDILRSDGVMRAVSVINSPIVVGDEVIGIYGIVRDITERKSFNDRLRASEAYANSIIDALASSIAILDGSGRIVRVNRRWTEFAASNGGDEALTGIGANYLDVCEAQSEDGFQHDDGCAFAAGVRSVMNGSRQEFSMKYPCHSPIDRHWFVGRVTRFGEGEGLRIVVTHDSVTELERAEQARQERREELELAVKVGKILMYHVLPKAHTATWFGDCKAIFGVDVDEYPGTLEDFLSRIHPDDLAMVRAKGDDAGHYNYDFRVIWPDGSVHWLQSTGKTEVSESGDLLQLIGATVNIDDRKRSEEEQRLYAEKALADSELRLQTVVNNAPVGLLAIDTALIFTLAEGRGVKPFVGSQEIVGRSVTDVCADIPDFVEAVKRCIAGETLSATFDLPNAVLAARFSPTFGDDGQVVGLVCVTADVTGRHRAEAKFRAVLESAPDAMVVTNADGDIVLINARVEKLFGYERKDLLGQNIDILMPDEFRSQHAVDRVEFFGAPHARQMGEGRSLLAVDKNGRKFPVEVSLSPLETDEGTLVTAAIRDISERFQAEQALIRAQKMETIGQLTAGIAHEINTPTQYIGDNTRFLQHAFASVSGVLRNVASVTDESMNVDADELDYLVGEIPIAIRQKLEGIERVNKIVRALKVFSHPGGETKSAFNVNAALESTITVTQNEWKYAADIVTEFDPDIPPVVGFIDDLNQVFVNLIVNAAHAIADSVQAGGTERGTITISTRSTGNDVEIRISDTGTGIPKEIQARVFDLFFTTKVAGRGTGQGLALAHSVVVDKHDGRIAFETQAGLGTTFIVTLPSDPNADTVRALM